MKNFTRALFAPLLLALALLNSGVAYAAQVNAQTGTSYTLLNTDCDPQGKVLVTFSNASAIAVTLPQAGGSGNFLGGCIIQVDNVGGTAGGNVTITPTTSTIDGLTSIVIPPYGSATIVNSSTAAGTGNYFTIRGIGTPATKSWSNFRNYLDNGAFAVAQRGTAATAGGVHTAGCAITNYVADRWCVDTNVTSGVGYGQVITASPAPATGFTNAMKIYRNSASLLQPVCAIQEIPTKDSTQLAGQTATLSYYAQALAGAPTASQVNAYVIYGTGSDEGLATFSTSPAVTPAWTGITALGGTAQAVTTSWVRYSTTVAIPSTATEVGVELCFTPGAETAGATDGFAFDGVQLEDEATPSPFEFRPYGIELAKAQQYYVQWADAAATLYFPATCVEYTSGTVARCNWALPQTMRAVPTPTINTATSFGMTKVADGTAEACSTFAVVASAANTNNVTLSCAASETAAVGTMHLMIGAASGATNLLTVSADF